MNLEEFLSGADPDSAVALNQARSYQSVAGKMISADVMTMLLVMSGLYSYLKDVAANAGHPARDMCMALMDRVQTASTFNFDPNHPKGQINRGMLDALQTTLMPEKSAEIAQLSAMLDAESGEQTRPFASITLADVLAIRSPSVEFEAAYPGNALYLVSTAHQGLDVIIELPLPAEADLRVEAYLATCADSESQDEPLNFVRHPQSIGFVTIPQGETRGVISVGSRKVRTYNKVFVKGAFSTPMIAFVQNNRG